MESRIQGQESLLIRSPSNRRPWGKVPVVLLLTVVLLALALLVTLHVLHKTTDNRSSTGLDQLCATSPNLQDCLAVVSDALLEMGNISLSPVNVLNSVLNMSLLRLDSAVAEVASVNGTKQMLALADCGELLNFSRDRIKSSALALAAGAYTDARTWLSALLDNYVSCLDGLHGVELEAMNVSLRPLTSLASASLAVLNTISSNDSLHHDYVLQFPSWMQDGDRNLLLATGVSIQGNVVVAKDGSGKYTTVQAAVDSAPSGAKTRFVIYVKKGTYKENVNIGITKSNIMIAGDGMDATIITGNRNVVDGATTLTSATLAANGDGFILQDLKIENTAGPEKQQAVALLVSGDKSVINRCNIAGFQDTLFARTNRQFYRDSIISGTIDYIFGNAAVVLQNCQIVSRRPLSYQKNVITAQGRTDPNQNSGTSVQNCRVVPGTNLKPVRNQIWTYLGRLWKQYSRTVFMESYLDDHINPDGWLEWDGDFALKTLYYGEYKNQGPGAGTSTRVNWPGYRAITSASVAEKFTVAALLQGDSWLKPTGVTYNDGL